MPTTAYPKAAAKAKSPFQKGAQTPSQPKPKAKVKEPARSLKWQAGKTKPVATDRGNFSFKKNRKGD